MPNETAREIAERIIKSFRDRDCTYTNQENIIASAIAPLVSALEEIKALHHAAENSMEYVEIDYLIGLEKCAAIAAKALREVQP